VEPFRQLRPQVRDATREPGVDAIAELAGASDPAAHVEQRDRSRHDRLQIGQVRRVEQAVERDRLGRRGVDHPVVRCHDQVDLFSVRERVDPVEQLPDGPVERHRCCLDLRRLERPGM
jgi:hypothetical protein